MSMPEDIWITDTSFRDGQQSVNPYTTEQIVELYKLMNKLGGPYGLIRQTEFFIYSKKDREAVERCQALGFKFPEITTWIRGQPGGLPSGKGHGHTGDGHSGLLQRLSYI